VYKIPALFVVVVFIAVVVVVVVALLRKDMVVNEHDRLSIVTLRHNLK